ncbi:hypothetical protein MDAP_000655 [Mitosporidium daphniae]
MNLGARQSSINNGVSGLILCFLISCIVLLIYCLHLYIFKECFENSKTFWDNAPARHVDKAARPFQKSEPLSKDDVIWFLHVSDIHISKLSSRSSDHFLSFVDNILPTVNPSFVLATGDLTDGKFKGTIKTGQVLEEWKFYYDTLMSRKINSSRWIDLPGNHDKFDVADHRKNFYSLFGLQANYDQILHTVSTRIGDINILSLDARPYMDRLEKALNSPKIQNSDPLKTIAICHYPLCTMTFSQSSLGTPFSTLTKKISLYLSGHLHNLIFGLGDDLTTIHNTGFTEIEVGDLQAHKQFNLYSMTSRNTFSWSSHTIEDKILLHVISPKSSRFVLTDRESNWIGRDENGNLLVDLLLFPVQNTSISHLTITIDGNSKTIQSHEITLPFFTYSFEGTRNINSEQSHALLVTAVLDDNSTVSMGHSFSLCFENGFIYDTVGSKIMSFPFVSFFKALYWISYSLVLLFFGAFIYFLIPHGHGVYWTAVGILLGTNSDTMPLHSAESFEGFLLFHKIHLFASENPNVRVTDVHIGFGQWHDAVLYVATSDSSCMLCIDALETMVISGAFDGDIFVYLLEGMENSASPFALKGHACAVNSLSITGQSPFLVSGDESGCIFVWDLVNKLKIRTFNYPGTGLSFTQVSIKSPFLLNPPHEGYQFPLIRPFQRTLASAEERHNVSCYISSTSTRERKSSAVAPNQCTEDVKTLANTYKNLIGNFFDIINSPRLRIFACVSSPMPFAQQAFRQALPWQLPLALVGTDLEHPIYFPPAFCISH